VPKGKGNESPSSPFPPHPGMHPSVEPPSLPAPLPPCSLQPDGGAAAAGEERRETPRTWAAWRWAPRTIVDKSKSIKTVLMALFEVSRGGRLRHLLVTRWPDLRI